MRKSSSAKMLQGSVIGEINKLIDPSHCSREVALVLIDDLIEHLTATRDALQEDGARGRR